MEFQEGTKLLRISPVPFQVVALSCDHLSFSAPAIFDFLTVAFSVTVVENVSARIFLCL